MTDSALSDRQHCGAGHQPETYFASAGRDAPDEFGRKTQAVAATPFLKQALDAMPSMVMILNDHRQIVAANETLFAVLHAAVPDVVGKRPGEALGCIRASAGPDGCGTARHCAACGAVQAIIESRTREQKIVRECRVSINSSVGTSALDLRVTATPITVGADRYVIASVEDISHSNRLAVLQRTFFHDVLNTAGCIQGYTHLFAVGQLDDQEACDGLTQLTKQLVETIQNHRDVTLAETGDLQVHLEPFDIRGVLEELRQQYRMHLVAEHREIQLQCGGVSSVVTDRPLLMRVLGNMLKNALEATAPGGIATIGCRQGNETLVFWAHNADVMPDDVQLQIFQRSFSTKGGSGRGIGTYSMQLFGERYLGGKVGFVSKAPEGTTFTLTLPDTPTTT